MTEILEELPRLGHSERQAILRRLIELDAGIDIEETPEMLAAIDAGVSSLETGSGVPLEQARQPIAGCAIRQFYRRSPLNTSSRSSPTLPGTIPRLPNGSAIGCSTRPKPSVICLTGAAMCGSGPV